MNFQTSIKTIIFSTIILVSGSHGYGMYDNDIDYGPRGYGYGGYDRETSRLLGKIKLANSVSAGITTQEKKIETLRKEMKSSKSDAAKTALKRELQYTEKYAEMLRERQRTLMQPTSMGMLVARGLAGKDSSVLDDYNIDSILEGVGKGFLVRASRATGDVFSKKVAGTVETVLGGAWDTIFGMLIDFWADASSVVFHGSASSFKAEELASWKAFVIGRSGAAGILDDIGAILKDGMGVTLRGHDMTLRQFDVAADAEKNETIEEKEIKTTIWMYLVQGYAKQFDRLVEEFDKRKKYYREDSLEVFYASQIQERLLQLRDLLLKSNTLNDLNSQIDSNRLLIVAYKNQIANMFERLNDCIKPRTLSLDGKTNFIDERSRRSSRSYDDDDDMPHRMSGY